MSMAMAILMTRIGMPRMPIKNGTVDTADLLLVFEKFDRPVNLGGTATECGECGIGLAAA